MYRAVSCCLTLCKSFTILGRMCSSVEDNLAVSGYKTCIKCGVSKPGTVEFFLPIRGKSFRGECRSCYSEYHKLYRSKDKEKWKNYNRSKQREHRNDPAKYAKSLSVSLKSYHNNKDKNKDKRSIYDRSRYLSNREYRIVSAAMWRKNNPQRCREMQKKAFEKRRMSPKWRICDSMSTNVRNCLRRGKEGFSWRDLVDYSVQDLIVHLERQFKTGMNWENYGGWEIDHIVPLSSFEFDSYDHPEFKAAWTLTNLRPLWKKDNQSKGAKREFLI